MKANRENLLNILSLLKPGLAKRNVIEQTTHYLFSPKDISTYNDQICVSYPFENDLQCSVRSTDLLKALSGARTKEVELIHENNELRMKAGTRKAGISTVVEDKIENLVMAMEEERVNWLPLPPEFIKGLSLCRFSASKIGASGIVATIYANGNDILSTDDKRASWYSMKEPISEPLFVPAKASQELIKFLDLESYTLSPSWIHFRTKKNVFFSIRRMLFDQSFPDVKSEVASITGTTIELPKKVKDIAESVIDYAEGEVDMDKHILMEINGGILTMSALQETKWIKDRVSITNPGKDFSFDINPSFLIDVMGLGYTTITVSEDHKALFASENFKHIMLLPMKGQ